MWSWLRDRRFDGLKFRRQVAIGRYIVDLYCAERQLAIEIDGRQHQLPEMIDYDPERSRYLAERGIYVLRIANELMVDSETVAEVIRWAVQWETPSSAFGTFFPLRRGEGS